MIFCARATRGLGRPSLDARSGSSISPHPWRETERVWRDETGVARCPSCSQNAHDQNVLVRRAQSRIDQATLGNKTEIGITRAMEGQSAPIPEERTSKP